MWVSRVSPLSGILVVGDDVKLVQIDEADAPPLSQLQRALVVFAMANHGSAPCPHHGLSSLDDEGLQGGSNEVRESARISISA